MPQLAIESIKFSNFKALVNTTLPLGPFTLIVGPNGSGKSTALQAINLLRRGRSLASETSWLKSIFASETNSGFPTLAIKWCPGRDVARSHLRWANEGDWAIENWNSLDNSMGSVATVNSFFTNMRVYSLEPTKIELQVQLAPGAELENNGTRLAAVLDQLRDQAPERFESVNEQLGRWIPEFDKILFENPEVGHRRIKLRTRLGGHSIPASQVSQGTLLALTMLTLAYLPSPPTLIGLEEPDRGIHPRLLRDVRDALYRLAYPESFGETRPPVQVIATTQSPYFLDLFREHPEEIVIAEKNGLTAEFMPLAKHPHIEDILADAPLGEVWYSGVLGGVPIAS